MPLNITILCTIATVGRNMLKLYADAGGNEIAWDCKYYGTLPQLEEGNSLTTFILI
jgi:hypothetical protein